MTQELDSASFIENEPSGTISLLDPAALARSLDWYEILRWLDCRTDPNRLAGDLFVSLPFAPDYAGIAVEDGSIGPDSSATTTIFSPRNGIGVWVPYGLSSPMSGAEGALHTVLVHQGLILARLAQDETAKTWIASEEPGRKFMWARNPEKLEVARNLTWQTNYWYDKLQQLLKAFRVADISLARGGWGGPAFAKALEYPFVGLADEGGQQRLVYRESLPNLAQSFWKRQHDLASHPQDLSDPNIARQVIWRSVRAIPGFKDDGLHGFSTAADHSRSITSRWWSSDEAGELLHKLTQYYLESLPASKEQISAALEAKVQRWRNMVTVQQLEFVQGHSAELLRQYMERESFKKGHYRGSGAWGEVACELPVGLLDTILEIALLRNQIGKGDLLGLMYALAPDNDELVDMGKNHLLLAHRAKMAIDFTIIWGLHNKH